MRGDGGLINIGYRLMTPQTHGGRLPTVETQGRRAFTSRARHRNGLVQRHVRRARPRFRVDQ